ARYVATAITGGEVQPYTSNDYVWSDQYDWKVHSVGWRDPAGSSTVIGDLLEDGRVAVIHADADGTASGAVTVNWVRALNQARRVLAGNGTATALVEELQQRA
ncbi:oxidoreductase C-terminal domain-containing protein, partial [Arthrobacter sp. HMWF013]|uniref:oxidoreductase C-terminal domain-containing protein n=1 Tax=Arthrobacter sp. HMWF013 TaxID=2056849 RepID=UPI000D4AB96B